MSDSEWLAGLKVGDEVVLNWYNRGLVLSTVARAGKLHIVLTGKPDDKFRRHDGIMVGSEGYHRPRLMPPTDKAKVQICRQKALFNAGRIKWESYPTDAIEAALKCLEGQESAKA